jgi:drug/metabolite transporter (DMT)-like permease
MTKGIKYMLAAVLFFSFMNISVKMLGHLPAEEISFVRGFVLVFVTIWMLKREKEPIFGHNRPVLALRGLLGGISMIAYFYAIHLLPLATATVFYHLSAILTALFASWFLGEKLKPITLFFFVISMSGVLLVRGFDARVTMLGLTCGLVNAVFAAGAYTAIGRLKGKESATTVVFYLALVSGILSFCLLTFRQSWKMPIGTDWAWLALQSATALLGQLFMTKAYLHEKSANVAIVNYLGIFFAIGYGYFIWGETYNWQAFLGILLVLIGVVLNVFWERIFGIAKPL